MSCILLYFTRLEVREEYDSKARFNISLVVSVQIFKIILMSQLLCIEQPLKENDLRKPLQFRCDTADEMHSWGEAFRAVLTSSK
jgi:hypothetical protein